MDKYILYHRFAKSYGWNPREFDLLYPDEIAAFLTLLEEDEMRMRKKK